MGCDRPLGDRIRPSVACTACGRSGCRRRRLASAFVCALSGSRYLYTYMYIDISIDIYIYISIYIYILHGDPARSRADEVGSRADAVESCTDARRDPTSSSPHAAMRAAGGGARTSRRRCTAGRCELGRKARAAVRGRSRPAPHGHGPPPGLARATWWGETMSDQPLQIGSHQPLQLGYDQPLQLGYDQPLQAD